MKMDELKKKRDMLDMAETIAGMIKPDDSKDEEEEDDEDPVQEALETLIKAEKIKQDIPLMAKVQQEIRKQKKAITSIQDIKDRYVEVTIKTPEEDLLDPESGELTIKPSKADDEGDDDE